MYSIETVHKCAKMLRERVALYDEVPLDFIKLCISTGNDKIGNVMNVSLPPMLSCGNCAGCCTLCYDVKACMRFPNVVDARARNLAILRKDRGEYFARIEKAISRRRKNKFFRWHVAGDIVDADYFVNMVEIARRHPDFLFWTYTKMYHIVNQYCAEHGKETIPENFSIMFSEWRGMPMDNPYGFAEFRVVFKDEDRPQGFYCPGNCDACKNPCRGCIAQETVYCMEH